ncbi:MAG: hypothetical protein EAY69_06125, partial [Cytophagales bacterium]
IPPEPNGSTFNLKPVLGACVPIPTDFVQLLELGKILIAVLFHVLVVWAYKPKVAQNTTKNNISLRNLEIWK